MTSDEARCVIVFVNEGDRIGHEAVVDHVMRRALDLGLGGASAFRAVESFGEHLRLRRSTLLSLDNDEGIAIVIADQADRIEALLERLDGDGVRALAIEFPSTLRRLGVAHRS